MKSNLVFDMISKTCRTMKLQEPIMSALNTYQNILINVIMFLKWQSLYNLNWSSILPRIPFMSKISATYVRLEMRSHVPYQQALLQFYEVCILMLMTAETMIMVYFNILLSSSWVKHIKCQLRWLVLRSPEEVLIQLSIKFFWYSTPSK